MPDLTNPAEGYANNNPQTEAELIAMGAKNASPDSLTQTLAVSKLTPGVTVEGATTDSTTQTDVMTGEPLKQTIQAYTNPNPSSIGSDISKNYVNGQTENAMKLADTASKAINGVAPTAAEDEKWKGYVTGGVNKLAEDYAYRDYLNRKAISQQSQTQTERLNEQQASETATSKASAFRTGMAGGAYSDAVLKKVEDEHTRQTLDYNAKLSDAVGSLMSSIISGEINNDIIKQKEIKALADQATQAQKDYVDMTVKLQKMKDDHATAGIDNLKKANDFVSTTADKWAEAGYTPSETEYQYLDSLVGAPAGTSKILANASRNSLRIKDAKSQAEQTKLEWDTASSIMDGLDKMGTGATISVGGRDYYYQGVDVSGLKTGVEVDKNTGKATYWQVNPRNKEVETVDMGFVSSPNAGNWEVKEGKHGLWRVNSDTGEMQLMTPTGSQKTLSTTVGLKEGSTSPFGANRGQCGAFVNDATGAEVGDTYESKMEKTDPTIKPGTDNPPRYGDFFVQKLGTWTGHTGIVLDTVEENGKQFVNVIESNLKGDGKIGYRTIPVENIDGFGRTGNISGLLKIGSDSSIGTEGIDFSKEFGSASGKTEIDTTGLDSTKQSIANQLSVELYGKTKATDPTNLQPILDQMKAGKDINTIRNDILYSKYGTKFTGAFQDAAMFLARNPNLPADRGAGIIDEVGRRLAMGDEEGAKDYIRVTATNALPAESEKKAMGVITGRALIDDIGSKLKEYEAKGGNTNIFTGTEEKVLEKIGSDKNPETAALASQIQSAIQQYRVTMTGQAFTESETKEYKTIFPSIGNTAELNSARIEGLKRTFDVMERTYLERAVGKSAYDELFASKPSYNKGDRQELNGKVLVYDGEGNWNEDPTLSERANRPEGETRVVNGVTWKWSKSQNQWVK